MKQRRLLLDDEIRLLNDRRATLDRTPYKKYGDPVSKDDIKFINESRKLASEEKFKIGRKVILTEHWYGDKKGLVGWVTDVWPKTKILFENGREPNLGFMLAEVLEAVDEYASDLEELRERIENKSRRGSKSTRKSTY